jgi:hypothetical protein
LSRIAVIPSGFGQVMKMRFKFLLPLCLAFGLSFTAVPPAYADMTKSQAAAKAKARHGGKVLSVEKIPAKKPGGAATFKVRLLIDGRVKTVTIRG